MKTDFRFESSDQNYSLEGLLDFWAAFSRFSKIQLLLQKISKNGHFRSFLAQRVIFGGSSCFFTEEKVLFANYPYFCVQFTWFSRLPCKLNRRRYSKSKMNHWNSIEYLKEKSCLREELSRVSRIFARFTKLNPREKCTSSQFAKSNPHEIFKKWLAKINSRQNFSR